MHWARARLVAGGWALCVSTALLLPVAVRAQTPVYRYQWGSYGVGNDQFKTPVGVASSPSGEVFVLDSGNARVQVFTREGVFLRKWGSLGSGFGQFVSPASIAVDPSGNVFVKDSHRVQKFSSTGAILQSWAVGGNISTDAAGNLYTSFPREQANSYLIVKYRCSDGAFLAQWIYNGTLPDGLAADLAGDVYVADPFDRRVTRFSASGQQLAQWGWWGEPVRLAVDGGGVVHAVDNLHSRIMSFTNGGSLLYGWGNPGSTDGLFQKPIGIAVDSDGRFYVADTNNSRIQVFSRVLVSVRATSWGRVKALYR